MDKEFLKRTFGYGFSISRHMEEYRRIAGRYHVRPRLVYRLAHGKTARGRIQELIREELLSGGVIIRK